MWWIALLALGTAEAQDRGARADDVAFDPSAEETYVPAPKDRLHYTNATYGRVNPLGFVDVYRLGWQRRLSTKDSTLFHDTYSFVAAEVTATPAYTRVGVFAEAQVLAILRVFGSYSVAGYYGTFDQLQSWDDRSVRYSDNTLSDSGDQAYGALGTVFNGGGTLRAAVGPIAIRSTLTAARFDLDLADGDVVFYEQTFDRLTPDGGWLLVNDADLLALLGPARVGIRHSWSSEPGNDSNTDGAMDNQRLGPLFAWQFKDEAPGAKFNQPTLFLLTQWWLQHPYRTGEEQSQALPLVALGFAFNGDLAVSSD